MRIKVTEIDQSKSCSEELGTMPIERFLRANEGKAPIMLSGSVNGMTGDEFRAHLENNGRIVLPASIGHVVLVEVVA
ncbi:hypothetical protein F1188_16125 [Roseospira marina]|uniref:Uncharacterized protein n=1 Tax=Roseospira marina TaxID=140057 RepID=A0A5M6I8X3_9PROT|nr:hypothetical protein [Roseospira marina]KAA5604387.1 hypothetical protein F1188_16125 [Roseospira marina]MBB4315423.1 hypothetical protein [Roseospira marina]MBB5088431.1 hypothetical protein [Roseospira marina]